MAPRSCRRRPRDFYVDWDKHTTRPAVRRAYRKTVKCRTFALGALLFASGNELRLVPGSCKSRGCPSCGQRNTEQWQREHDIVG